MQLVRATRDSLRDGRVYIHCHHGKHRSAAAAAVAISSLGYASPQEMIARMRVSGTSPNYKGLFALAERAEELDSAVIDSTPANFPSVERATGIVKAMIELDEIDTRLRLIERAGWKTPADHPDLVPEAEAARMARILRELTEGAWAEGERAVGERARTSPAEFDALLRQNSAQAATLGTMLRNGRSDPTSLSKQLNLLVSSCKGCHIAYRD